MKAIDEGKEKCFYQFDTQLGELEGRQPENESVLVKDYGMIQTGRSGEPIVKTDGR